MTDYDFPFSDLLKLYPACQHDVVRKQGCDLQNVLRQSYDYLATMAKLRWTYDRRPIYQKKSYDYCRINLR